MLRSLFILTEIIIYFFLYIRGKDSIPFRGYKKTLREKGFWWIVTIRAGFTVFRKIKARIRNSSHERLNVSRFNELFGNNGFLFYEISRSAQLSLLLILLIFAQIVFFYIRFDASSILFGGGWIAAILIIPDKVLENMCLRRRTTIENSMPDFLNRLAILVDAGLTVKTSLQRIITNCQENDLYIEIKGLLHNLEAGLGENHSFEEFARRCNTPTATAFAAIVLQNIKKGNRELSAILRIFAGSCWETRKFNARKKGEEAAAKLMIPMMIIFIAIMILMAAPALFKLSF